MNEMSVTFKINIKLNYWIDYRYYFLIMQHHVTSSGKRKMCRRKQWCREGKFGDELFKRERFFLQNILRGLLYNLFIYLDIKYNMHQEGALSRVLPQISLEIARLSWKVRNISLNFKRQNSDLIMRFYLNVQLKLIQLLLLDTAALLLQSKTWQLAIYPPIYCYCYYCYCLLISIIASFT